MKTSTFQNAKLALFNLLLASIICETLCASHHYTSNWAAHDPSKLHFTFTDLPIPLVISHREWNSLRATVSQLINELKDVKSSYSSQTLLDLKAQLDKKADTTAVATNIQTAKEELSAKFATDLGKKADTTTVATNIQTAKEELSVKFATDLGGKADSTTVASNLQTSRDELASGLALKADSSTTATNLQAAKDELLLKFTSDLDKKADTTAVATGIQTAKEELSAKFATDLSKKADSTTVASNLQTSRDELASGLAPKADSSTTATNLQAVKDELLLKFTTDLEKKADTTSVDSNLQTAKTELSTTFTTGLSLKADSSTVASNLQAAKTELTGTFTTGLSSKADKTSTEQSIATLTSTLNARTSAITDIGHIPTSCLELKTIGYMKNGLYLIKGTKFVETVSCNFNLPTTDLGFQTRIGFADIKSLPVYFHVQRSTVFSTLSAVIPWEVEKLNVGSAMTLSTGIFKAPKPGTYFFTFTGLSNTDTATVDVTVGLFVNNVRVTSGYANLSDDTLVSQISIHLNKDDTVSMKLLSGTLYDSGNHYTTFTGFLLEEDLF